MYVFGGGDARRALNDVHVFDLSIMAWSRPADTGVLPSARAGHAAVALGTFIAVFGGASPDGTVFNDLHLLDTSYSLFDDGGANSDSSTGSIWPQSSLRKAVQPPAISDVDVRLGMLELSASPAAAALAISHVTQSDNEARLPQRVVVSRVAVVVPSARPATHSLESLRTAMGGHWRISGVRSELPSEACNAATVSSDLIAAVNPVRCDVGNTSATHESRTAAAAAAGAVVAAPCISGLAGRMAPSAEAGLKERLLALVIAQQDADERRFAALSTQIQFCQSERRAEYTQLKAIIKRLLS
jgi:hypothetical protein